MGLYSCVVSGLGSLALEINNTQESVRHFPGGPVVKTCPSNVEDASSILGQGAKRLHASGPVFSGPKKPKQKTEAILYVTNPILTLKMVHIKKKKKKNLRGQLEEGNLETKKEHWER